jgi:hypothetical protein
MPADDYQFQDSTQGIAVARVSTGDLIVHYKDDDGYWHRLHASTTKTACGKPVNYHRAPDRAKPGRRLEHPLAWPSTCGGVSCCWTDAERLEADQNWFEKFGRYPNADDF